MLSLRSCLTILGLTRASGNSFADVLLGFPKRAAMSCHRHAFVGQIVECLSSWTAGCMSSSMTFSVRLTTAYFLPSLHTTKFFRRPCAFMLAASS
jgi:hypothetical protein